MTGHNEVELYKLHRQGQDKYAYFLLAAAGAAIGFALSQTREQALSVTHALLGLAALLWGFSFFAGCRHLTWIEAALYTNTNLLRLQRGADPIMGSHPELMAHGDKVFREVIETQGNKSSSWAKAQFASLIAGGVAYIGWHVIEMYLRN